MSEKETIKEILRTTIFTKFYPQYDWQSKHELSLTDILYQRYRVDDPTYVYWDVLNKVLEYFENKVIPHKMEVFKAGIELIENPVLGMWFNNKEFKQKFLDNLWVHDLSKFSANEAKGYAIYDHKNPLNSTKADFEAAWHHHKMNNPHHPEYWLNSNRSGVMEPVAMPDIYIMEMIADWIGAGRTYGNTLEGWLPDNLPKFVFRNKGLVANILNLATGINIQVGQVFLSVLK